MEPLVWTEEQSKLPGKADSDDLDFDLSGTTSLANDQL